MTPDSTATDYSLQTRLLIVFSILLGVFLSLTGVVLDGAFRNSIEAGAQDRLQGQIYLLLAGADEENGEFFFLETLQEPRFSQLDSGLYGFINSTNAGELWRSDSARAFSFPEPEILQQLINVGETRFDRVAIEDEETYFILRYGILWEDDNEYSFSVVENAAPYYSEISNFRTNLWSWLGGVAVLLLLIQFYLMKWGLSPLQRMANDLKQIELGSKDKLEGDYPRELRGVTNNLNVLIESERKQQSRYRTTLGDLAHSLKTPLAVIAGILPKLKENPTNESGEQLDSVNDQLDRMSQIVTYQLQRAVQSNNSSSLGKHVNAATAIEKVLDALAKVYTDKGMELETQIDQSAVFNGDERDLMEVLGNILDNAFKYGDKKIRVGLIRSGADKRDLNIIVEDDGPGVPADKQEFILQRGARADTLVQGQGIGLAVVTDIVSSYGGEIGVEKSDLGGAKIKILFRKD
ncbi:MAG: two-component sensor histidine kinase [Pseudomonadales bacterium]|nr:two-component sensor histidine kinase [Pseudomonadales bacterium]